MGVKKVLYRVGDSIANLITNLSTLSSEQLMQINSNREDYLSKIPNTK